MPFSVGAAEDKSTIHAEEFRSCNPEAGCPEEGERGCQAANVAKEGPGVTAGGEEEPEASGPTAVHERAEPADGPCLTTTLNMSFAFRTKFLCLKTVQ